MDYLLAQPSQKKQPLDKLLKIGDLAHQTNETVVTIRHWTNEGLLQLADRTNSGYRLYDESMVQQAKKIRELQEKRLTLAEIKEKL